jgi:cubilin
MCEKGKVKVYDQSLDGKLLGTFCGYQNPTPLFSASNKVIIKIIPADGVKIHANLDITYVANNISQGCGGEIFNYGGLISSPLYPENNRSNLDCVWSVNVPNNMVVALKFKVFDLGSKTTCASDYVQIIEPDEPIEDQRVKRQYCGDDEPAIYKAQTSVIQIRYKKSVNFAGTGWLLQFMAVYPNAEINAW